MARTNSSAPSPEPPPPSSTESEPAGVDATDTTPATRDPLHAKTDIEVDTQGDEALEHALAAERVDQVSDGDPG